VGELLTAVDELPEDPTDEALHHVRIKAKRCRYAAEAVAPAVGKRARAFAKAIADVQDVLGDHQDAVVAEQWLRDVSSSTIGREVFVAGQLATLERVEIESTRAAWGKVWQAASKEEAPAVALKLWRRRSHPDQAGGRAAGAGGRWRVLRRQSKNGCAQYALCTVPATTTGVSRRARSTRGDRRGRQRCARSKRTGVRLPRLPKLESTRYRDRKGRLKQVRYWLMGAGRRQVAQVPAERRDRRGALVLGR
jgi:hypothetical protein